MQLDYQPVANSSMIEALAYDFDESILGVRFKGGREYLHSDVSPETFHELRTAESAGKYYNAAIKGKFGHLEMPAKAEAAAPEQAIVAPIPAATDSGFASPEQAIETANTSATALSQIMISSAADRGAAGERLIQIARQIKDRVEYFKPMKEAAAKAHRAICAKENEALAPLKAADMTIRSALRLYDDNEERTRRAEEARLREIERVRVADEAKRAADDAAIIDAQIAMAEGRPEEAEAMIANPLPFAAEPPRAIVLEKQVPKVQGLSETKVWKHRVINEAAIPREYLMIDESKIRKIVEVMGDKHGIPGVEAFEERVYRAATGRKRA